jgi:hypothetical protein
MNDTAPPVANPGELDKRVGQYVALRDKIKAMKEAQAEALKPYQEGLEMLNTWLLDYLNKTGAKHVATENGTIYRIIRVSASLADSDVFWKYVLDNQEWRLLDRRANVTGVQQHIQDKGDLPPGVNLNQYSEAGVRRS